MRGNKAIEKNESHGNDGPRHVKRQPVKGPSPILHGILAVLVFLSVLSLAYTVPKLIAQKRAETDRLRVEIPDLPEDVKAAEISKIDETEELPDLLGDLSDEVIFAEPGEEIEPEKELIEDEVNDALALEESIKALTENGTSEALPQVIRINGEPIGQEKAKPLIKAPIVGLYKKTPYGNIPAKKDGNSAYALYSKPFNTPLNTRKLGIVVGGLGLDGGRTNAAISQLPQNVTLSFAAHSPDLQGWIDKARENGHEVLLELPMESLGSPIDPLTRMLSATSSESENLTRLEWLLSRGAGYFAVMNYNGDSYLNDQTHAQDLMANLSETGLGFIFDNSFEALSLPVLATRTETPFIASQIVLDEVNQLSAIRANLDRLAEQATLRQSPIGVAFAYDTSVSEISKWANELTGKGIILAPVSHIMKR